MSPVIIIINSIIVSFSIFPVYLFLCLTDAMVLPRVKHLFSLTEFTNFTSNGILNF